MPRYAKYVGRPTKWGNPFRIGEDGTLEEVLQKYRSWLEERCEETAAPSSILNAFLPVRGSSVDVAKVPSFLMPLVGQDLACFCPLTERCHADILLEFVERYVGAGVVRK
jgi:hypothetical protein